MASIQLIRGHEDVAFAEQLRVDLALRQFSVSVAAFTTGGPREQTDSVSLAIMPDERTADHDAFLVWMDAALTENVAPILIVPQQNTLSARLHSRAAGIVFSRSLSYDELFEELFRNLFRSFPAWLDIRIRPTLLQSPTGVTWWSDDLIVADRRFEHAVRISPNDSRVVVPGLEDPQHISVNRRRLSIANSSGDEILECEIVDDMAMDLETIRSVDALDLSAPHDVRHTPALSVIADTGHGRVLFRHDTRPWRAAQFEDTLETPAAVSVDETGFWVVDTTRHRVLKCDADGRQVFSFGSHGRDLGDFDRPVGVCRWGDLLFVAEEGNERLQMLDVVTDASTGGVQLIPRIESLASGFIGQPFGLSVNATNRLAVSDRTNKCVWLIDLPELIELVEIRRSTPTATASPRVPRAK